MPWGTWPQPRTPVTHECLRYLSKRVAPARVAAVDDDCLVAINDDVAQVQIPVAHPVAAR